MKAIPIDHGYCPHQQRQGGCDGIERDPGALGRARCTAERATGGMQRMWSGPNLKHSQGLEVDLVGPVPGGQSPQGRKPDGITDEQFCVDREANVAICPAGQISHKGSQHDSGGTQFRFQRTVCAACPLQARCCNGPNGRTITVSPDHEILSAAGVRQDTDEFKTSLSSTCGGIRAVYLCWPQVRPACETLYRPAQRSLAGVIYGCGGQSTSSGPSSANLRPQVRRKGAWAGAPIFLSCVSLSQTGGSA